MYYKYTVTFWDCSNTQESMDEGMVHAKNYGKAAMKVVDEYGENCVMDIYLKEIDSLDCVTKEEINNSFYLE